MRRGRIVWPGAGRLTLVLLLVIPAALAYPWRDSTGRWILGTAVIGVAGVLMWWRGRHVTSILARRLTVRRGIPGVESVRYDAADAATTVALRVLDHETDELPTALIAGYLDRYGIRGDAVRIITRETATTRDTWIGITISARANLAALQARSADLPLIETAEVVLRRLAEQLREDGWQVSTAQPAEVPDILGPQARHRWTSVEDGEKGYLATYDVGTDGHDIGAALAELRAVPATELWTVRQFSADGPMILVCTIRTVDKPSAPPLPRLHPHNGRQHVALRRVHPLSAHLV